jgi:RNA polymerase sigma factor FliA
LAQAALKIEVSPEELADIWGRWSAQPHRRSAQDRARLVEAYTTFTRRLAARCYARRVSDEVEFGDFLQLGMVGLIESVERFNPERGVRFETFAGHRIEGSILNGIETLSERQQQVAARRSILRERGRSLLEPKQKATHENGALERLADLAIGLALGFGLEDSGLNADGEPSMPDNAYSRLEMVQLKQQLAELVQCLPDQEKTVIYRHYFQQVRFDEIAGTAGLTKGRISQIHQAALMRLRMMYRERPKAALVI